MMGNAFAVANSQRIGFGNGKSRHDGGDRNARKTRLNAFSIRVFVEPFWLVCFAFLRLHRAKRILAPIDLRGMSPMGAHAHLLIVCVNDSLHFRAYGT
jgi:hypothetical protein